MNSNKKTLLIPLFILVLITLFVLISGNAISLAAPESQLTVFPSPTPGPDGRIIYIVQEDDSWWLIAAIFSIELDQLLALNNATIDAIPQPGDEILLGLGGPADEISTPGPSPTPEELL
ncbi:MAG: LysM peptidoglycan-binding domain-containing protein, partial [Anaerolineales bacterium]